LRGGGKWGPGRVDSEKLHKALLPWPSAVC